MIARWIGRYLPGAATAAGAGVHRAVDRVLNTGRRELGRVSRGPGGGTRVQAHPPTRTSQPVTTVPAPHGVTVEEVLG